MAIRRLTAVAAIAAAVAPKPAWAWGSEGHQIIALVAASELTPAARAMVGELLGGNVAATMPGASTWADKIRRHRSDNAPWHYVDIGITSAGYDAAPECPKDAYAVGQVQGDTAIIGDFNAKGW